jgi:DNA-directed RNA polymerase specialized sigma24 family protein
MMDFARYESAAAHKLLTPQREIYFLQSARGLTYQEAATAYALEAQADHLSDAEVREAATFKYGSESC